MNDKQHTLICQGWVQHTHAYGPGMCCDQNCVRCLRTTSGTPPREETVNHPAHYGGEDNPHEVIKCLEGWSLNDFCLGNVIKYVARSGKKGAELDDLKKARWYLDRAITQREQA